MSDHLKQARANLSPGYKLDALRHLVAWAEEVEAGRTEPGVKPMVSPWFAGRLAGIEEAARLIETKYPALFAQDRLGDHYSHVNPAKAIRALAGVEAPRLFTQAGVDEAVEAERILCAEKATAFMLEFEAETLKDWADDLERREIPAFMSILRRLLDGRVRNGRTTK